MRIPFINSDPTMLKVVAEVCGRVDHSQAEEGADGAPGVQIAALEQPDEAIEYINYQMPQLILINFSDPQIDGFEIMRQIVADPWLNHGAIIAIFRGAERLERINSLVNTNIVHALEHSEVKQRLPKVLEEIRNNRQILFQRALQQEFFTDISGHFVLANDVSIVPFYANLLANYLYNMGFIEPERKANIGLSLTEMLINAIEHGNCGISAAEKRAYLEGGGTAARLIEQRCQDPAIATRRVHFRYEIRPAQSIYVIRDQGEGFDWRAKLREKEIDFLSEHGRGIWMTAHNVDHISYNDAGNEVTLRVEHRQNVSNALPTVFGNSEFVEFQPEEVVFRQGEESSFLYYIAEGEFRVEVNNRQLATINASDLLVGEMSFLLEETRSATVIANSKAKLIKISKEAFVETIKTKPYYGIFLAKLIAQRLQRLGQRALS
jgi:CheY-like chemotaxis protein